MTASGFGKSPAGDQRRPLFAKTLCSQCGQEFGPGDRGYSHCEDHSASSISLKDLPLFWQGRANALRIIDSHRAQSDATTLEVARIYEECAAELRAAISRL